MPSTLIASLRARLRPLKRGYERARILALELPHRFVPAERGTARWLIRKEIGYGGYVTNVARQKISAHDARPREALAFWGMTGGDRMLHQRYAPTYARYLEPFLAKGGLTLAEVGILKGTGLAIWCDLFPDARVLGLDIDLSHFEGNKANLERRGAFRANRPELHEYDQLVEDPRRVGEILRGATLDVVIDDGLHSPEAIVTTWRSLRPHLSPRFAYFIEDFPDLLQRCGGEFAGFECVSAGPMTVVMPKP